MKAETYSYLTEDYHENKKPKGKKKKKCVKKGKLTFAEYKHCLEANKPFRKKKIKLDVDNLDVKTHKEFIKKKNYIRRIVNI